MANFLLVRSKRLKSLKTMRLQSGRGFRISGLLCGGACVAALEPCWVKPLMTGWTWLLKFPNKYTFREEKFVAWWHMSWHPQNVLTGLSIYGIYSVGLFFITSPLMDRYNIPESVWCWEQSLRHVPKILQALWVHLEEWCAFWWGILWGVYGAHMATFLLDPLSSLSMHPAT